MFMCNTRQVWKLNLFESFAAQGSSSIMIIIFTSKGKFFATAMFSVQTFKLYILNFLLVCKLMIPSKHGVVVVARS